MLIILNFSYLTYLYGIKYRIIKIIIILIDFCRNGFILIQDSGNVCILHVAF